MKKNKIEEIEVEVEKDAEEDDDFGKKKKNTKKVLLEDEIEADFEELSVEDRLFNIEKRLNTNLIISVITIILVFITMIFAITNKGTKAENNNNPTSNSTTNSGNDSTYNYSTDLFDEIDPANISKESKGKTIVVMIGKQGCSACAMYAPTLALLQEDYDFTTKYIDFSKMITVNGQSAYISDGDGYNALTSLTGNGYNGWVKEHFGSTPLTLIVKDSKILYAVVGAAEDSTLTAQFDKLGIKKK